jgi:putative membrane protein
VSGGTVALILGIYERLVTAISHFDLTLVGQLRKRHWTAAAQHVDLRFLVSLGCGILAGIAALSNLIHFLLEHHHQYTFSAFFGLILVSCLVVGRSVAPKNRPQRYGAVLLGLAAAGFAFWLVGQPFLQPRPGYLYLFLCGTVAICAMILPGISGAFILLLLGKYSHVIGVIKDVMSFTITTEHILTLVVFASGCALGLVCFSKVLRRLLNHYHGATMAVLCGFMLGSLRKIWPFQKDLHPGLPLKEKTYEAYFPGAISLEVVLTFLIMLVAMFSLWAIDRWLCSPPEATTSDSGR